MGRPWWRDGTSGRRPGGRQATTRGHAVAATGPRTDGEQGEQRGDREAGVFRVDVPAEWVLSTVTWLVVAAADGVRLGRLAARDVERLLGATVLDGLRRPPAEGVS